MMIIISSGVWLGLFFLLRTTAVNFYPALGHFAASPFGIEKLGLSTGILFLTAALIKMRYVLRAPKTRSKLQNSNGEIIELAVVDRFTYIKLLPGTQNSIVFRYFVKTTAGNWQLPEDKPVLFAKLQPGTLIRAAVVQSKTTREILDFEIVSGANEIAAANPLNQVVAKVASEVKIIGYRDGQFQVNRFQPLKELKYYLVVNQTLLPVSGTVFSRTKLNQKYYEGLEQATTLQITVKDKYVYLGLPAGEDGPLTYNHFLVSASTWRLSPHLKDLFPRLVPGVSLQIALVNNCILDIDFLENTLAVPDKALGTVVGKVKSDVKITNFQNGRYSIKRTKSSYTPRHYFIVNNMPLEVTEEDFTRTPYYALFAGPKRQLVK
ncbi:hypothetical protein [Adhaeribacter rhizoryzae]|uniref:Uncharacterized protein n=1 Tax=Adhaeribacter rhizoryzae TaxID=2607907 RepID=A0A5M6DID2_9BACT|nr:hypothetical protein [Adhaeribacter rhizoryzae]KAA5545045.1 hypothetical protein F0145_13400 [Adhaeribacter rhizoryzae]